MAVRDHQAQALYQLLEQRRFGVGGMLTVLTVVLLGMIRFLGGLVAGQTTMTRNQVLTAAPATTTPANAALVPAAATSRVVGPRRHLDGVGVGYARSQEGAVAAAANFTRVLSSELILDTTSRRAAIDVLAAPEARGRLQRTFDQAVASLRQGLGVTGAAAKDAQVLLRATPVGWRVEDYGAGSAKVAIWVTSIGGSIGGAQGPAPIRQAWGTTTVTLRWAGGDWKQVDSTTYGPHVIIGAGGEP